jgi:hypothetical protein
VSQKGWNWADSSAGVPGVRAAWRPSDQPETNRTAPARTATIATATSSAPDEGALEHERPADERIRRADKAHDLDLLGAREDRQPDRVDDDEQHDEADHEEQHGARRPQDARDGEHALHQIFDVEHVAHEDLVLEGRIDFPDVDRVRQLDLEAGVQRVRIQVLGQVLATLRLK